MKPSLNLEEFLHLLYDKFYKLQQHTSETSKFFFLMIIVIPLWTLSKKVRHTRTQTRSLHILYENSGCILEGPYHLGGQVALKGGRSTQLPPDNTLQMKI